MFEDILRELRKVDQRQGGISIPIQMPLDGEGYFDRQCPSGNCQSGFKVLFEDWKIKVSDACVFCPICREEAEAGEWNTPGQGQAALVGGRGRLARACTSIMAPGAAAAKMVTRHSSIITLRSFWLNLSQLLSCRTFL